MDDKIGSGIVLQDPHNKVLHIMSLSPNCHKSITISQHETIMI